MDIQPLRYLVTLSETQNIRRAATLLRVSPPAISKAIRQLENELGYSLLVRTGRNIVLSDRAKDLSGRAKKVVQEFDSLRSKAEASQRQTIRIATFEVFSTYFLESFNKLPWSDHDLVLYDVIPGELERAVHDGRADYGITYLPVPMNGVIYEKAASIEMGVFAKKGAFPGVDQPDLPFVAPVIPLFGTPSRIRGLDGWPDDAYPRKVRYQVTLMESALELVRQGKCAGYFPVFVAEVHNRRMRPELRLERRSSPYGGRKCYTDVYLVRRQSDPEGRAYRQLAKAVRLYTKSQ